ncbi:MAG: PKD domain-containing protein, partial [Bacteroidota bacterium]
TANDWICEITDTATVYVMPAVMADFDFSPPVAAIFDPVFTFTDQSGGTVNYWNWNFGDGSGDTVQNPIHSYADTGTYQVNLLVSDSNGCVDSITQWVTVKAIYTLFAPNAFSPNGDGKNDYFLPIIQGMEGDKFEMFIYDRWGDMVYTTERSYVDIETSAPLIGWNGVVNYGNKIAQEDVYIWLVKTVDVDKKKHQYIGHVTLLR